MVLDYDGVIGELIVSGRPLVVVSEGRLCLDA